MEMEECAAYEQVRVGESTSHYETVQHKVSCYSQQ